MKTGDVVQDAQGRSYQVGPLLGRGLWGKSYLVRHGESSAEFVLKTPLRREDFAEAPTDRVLDACAEACGEQGRLLGEGTHLFLPPLQSRQAEDGSPMLVVPRFTTTLERRIQNGSSLVEVLHVLEDTLDYIEQLATEGMVHGNLRPSNILLSERGDVLLGDLGTPSALRARAKLAAQAERNPYLPPELRTASDVGIDAGVDTYAVAMILWQAVMTPRGTESPELPFPTEGLDKAALVDLKDRVVQRLQGEDSNPRFHARLSERIASTLNRALSKEIAPSPPYRFRKPADLRERLVEIRRLIRPSIDQVGRVLHARPPGSSTFESDEVVAFSVTVATTVTLDSHDEIACGIAIFNEDNEERVRDADCQYTVDPHVSGRWRFAFQLYDLLPARYKVRLAFAVRESGHPPATSETLFEVRAAPGYVPASKPAEPMALPFTPTRSDAPEPDTADVIARNPPSEAEVELEDPEDTDAEALAAPRPIAPPRPVAPPPRPAAPKAVVAPTPPRAPTPRAPLSASPPPTPRAPRPTPMSPLGSMQTPTPARQDAPHPAHTLGATHTMGNVAVAVAPLDTDAGDPLLRKAAPPRPPAEVTEPKFTAPTQVPTPHALHDVMDHRSWTDIPLPGATRDDFGMPVVDDIPDPNQGGPIAKFVELVRGDVYLMFMGAAGMVILGLILLLLVLNN